MSNSIEVNGKNFVKTVINKIKLVEKVGEIEVFIPQEPYFFQQYNHRVIIGIFPKLITSDEFLHLQNNEQYLSGMVKEGIDLSENKVIGLGVIELKENSMFALNIPITELKTIYRSIDYRGVSNEDKLKTLIGDELRLLHSSPTTKEQFLEYYNNIIENINQIQL
jgi:hypothetical protein